MNEKREANRPSQYLKANLIQTYSPTEDKLPSYQKAHVLDKPNHEYESAYGKEQEVPAAYYA